jgi:hypothetical protein
VFDSRSENPCKLTKISHLEVAGEVGLELFHAFGGTRRDSEVVCRRADDGRTFIVMGVENTMVNS